MLTELLPFSVEIDPVAIAGIGLWSLALYLGFSPVSDWVIAQLSRWFNFAERSLYTSQAEYDRTRQGREALNAIYASVCSIVPFLLVGGLCNYGVELGFGRDWAIALGMIACMSCGIYDLGRRDGQPLE
jgi:hypothetical protein